MFLKRLCALLILFSLFPFPAPAENALRGYSEKEGPAWAVFGTYPADESGEDAPVLWRVVSMDQEHALLLSEAILDVQPAHQGDSYQGFETSTLSGWLKGEFALRAFSEAERAAIVQVGDQADVSLPSAAMLKDGSLGFLRDADRQAAGTAYAVSKGLEVYGKGGASYWIADKAQSMQGGQRRVIKDGGMGYIRADAGYVGVRPILRLDLSRVSALSGEGTKKDPFVIAPGEKPIPTPSPSPIPTAAPEWESTGGILTEGFPALTGEGFLPAGQPEYVFIDEENGVWRYASEDLRIVIEKTQDDALKTNFLIAQVFVRQGAEGFRMVPHSPGNLTVNRALYKEKPARIAENNRLVFSMDGDYFIYRVSRAVTEGPSYPIGVVIRDGGTLFDLPPKPGREAYPPLDMLALYPGGMMKVYAANERTARELLDEGVRDVLSFGPVLIRDGKLSTFHERFGNTPQPRAAIGMVSPGHCIAVIAEGRIKSSQGISVRQLGEKMMDLGCTMAFNLDGGWTSAMVFMGKQLNQLDKSGVKNNARTQNEVMGIGCTEAFGEATGP